jgi:hypothetical protein
MNKAEELIQLCNDRGMLTPKPKEPKVPHGKMVGYTKVLKGKGDDLYKDSRKTNRKIPSTRRSSGNNKIIKTR